MNTLKPLLIVAVLAGIGYGVYVRINGTNDAPPPGVADSWDAPRVQLPDAVTAPGASPWGGTEQPAPPAGAAPAAPTTAPPYDPAPVTATTAPPAGEAAPSDAPPYNPPTVAPGAPYADTPAGGPPPLNQDAPAAGNEPPPSTAAMPGAVPGDSPQSTPYANAPAGEPAAAMPANSPAGAPPIGATAPAATPAAPNSFSAAMEVARRDLEAGQLASALRRLSGWYDDPRLTPAEKQQLSQMLDQVAGTVVYSTQHLLEAPYEVQSGERLEDIAQRYNVPWQLLAKINGIDDPQTLRAGERLKVMRGPFSAMINLEKRQLTLWLSDGSYAGRFPIGLGREHPLAEGVYAVSDKSPNPVYRGTDRSIGGGDPANPLGDRWIGLGSDLGIHGTNRPDSIGRTDLPGSVSLNPRDVADVYDILSVGSKVIVRR